MGIYTISRVQFSDLFEQEDPATREALIQAHTFLTYQRQFNNLSIQEARLRRHYQKDLAELTELQKHRASQQSSTAHPSVENGFEFSLTPVVLWEEFANPALDDHPQAA